MLYIVCKCSICPQVLDLHKREQQGRVKRCQHTNDVELRRCRLRSRHPSFETLSGPMLQQARADLDLDCDIPGTRPCGNSYADLEHVAFTGLTVANVFGSDIATDMTLCFHPCPSSNSEQSVFSTDCASV
jgi:hypothetical protein